MNSARPTTRTWPAAAVAAATVSAVLLTASPARPVPAPAAPATPATAPAHAVPAAAPADRSVAELLVALRKLYREAESASRAYHRTERELRDQQELTRKLERRLDRIRVRLHAEQREAGRIARARYRTGALGLPPAVRVLLADDPVRAMHHGHVLHRAAEQQQARVRGLASTERHRGAVAAEAREALERQGRLNDRKKRQRKLARERLRRVEELLVSLTPGQLAALRRLERQQPGGGTAFPPAADGLSPR